MADCWESVKWFKLATRFHIIYMHLNSVRLLFLLAHMLDKSYQKQVPMCQNIEIKSTRNNGCYFHCSTCATSRTNSCLGILRAFTSQQKGLASAWFQQQKMTFLVAALRRCHFTYHWYNCLEHSHWQCPDELIKSDVDLEIRAAHSTPNLNV